MKYIYPAIFEKDEYGGYNVTFPDIFGGVTCGDDEDDAVFMAKDLLVTMLTSAKEQCFKPHTLEETKQKFAGKKVIIIEVEI